MSTHRNFFSLAASLIFALLFSLGLFAADRTGPITAESVSADLKQAVDDKGYRVTTDAAAPAEFWFARALAVSSSEAPGALYPQLANGEFVAVVTFLKGTSDYRGQAIASGTYTLRYQYIPQDANHMGVSPNPDFLLAVPVTSDTNPAQPLPYKRLVSLSTKASGTAHPAVFSMAPAADLGSVTKNDQDMQVFSAEVPAADGKSVKLGIVVKGQAQ